MSDDPTQLVKERIERLLDEGDTSDTAAFRGLQYDLGLAWVHFPEGLRRPRRARPTHQRRGRAPPARGRRHGRTTPSSSSA